MDALSDILHGLRASGSVYFCDLLTPPWAFEYQKETQAMFHRLRRGRCLVEIGDERAELGPGDFLFLSPGVHHRVVSPPEDHRDSLMLCGYCGFDAAPNDPLMRALPRFILLRDHDFARWPWLTRTLDHLSAEFTGHEPGSALTVNKLTEVLLVQLLRINFGRVDAAGIIGALTDPRLARLLDAVHEAPASGWTMEKAAAIASVSRSGFARLFKAAVGMNFFDYLTRLRMRHARELLAASSLKVWEVAEHVGYRSELSFVKAFKKIHGMTPRQYRLQLTADGQ